jgi:hypothetical protein
LDFYREYLYSETELYSLLDLEQLYRGELLPTLGRAVDLCTAHVDWWVKLIPAVSDRAHETGSRFFT